jgi:hypothetical protein
MGKKKTPAAPTASSPLSPPQIFTATRGANGAVVKGNQITQPQAEVLRRAGQDVVVCGTNLAANRQLAFTIERNANGNAKRCPPHKNAGPLALPHYQPDPRGVAGHTFYETPNLKAQ